MNCWKLSTVPNTFKSGPRDRERGFSYPRIVRRSRTKITDSKVRAPAGRYFQWLCTLLLSGMGAAHAGEPITDFTYPWADKPAPRTEVQIHTTDDVLQFTFNVADSDIVYTEKWTGENTLDGEDRVEIFFAKDEQLAEYWCIEIDSQGRVHDYQASHYRNFDNTWNCPGLKTTAERTKTGYEVTATIPLATLGVLLGQPVKEGSQLRLGLFRAEFYGTIPDTHGNTNDNWISWVRPETDKPDFHVPSAFRLWAVPGAGERKWIVDRRDAVSPERSRKRVCPDRPARVEVVGVGELATGYFGC